VSLGEIQQTGGADITDAEQPRIFCGREHDFVAKTHPIKLGLKLRQTEMLAHETQCTSPSPVRLAMDQPWVGKQKPATLLLRVFGEAPPSRVKPRASVCVTRIDVRRCDAQ